MRLPQKAEANVNCRIFPGVKIETIRQQLQQLAGPDVTGDDRQRRSPESDATPLREDVTAAYKAALATRFKDAPLIPFMSAGATDGSYLRNAGIPVYGFGGLWGIVSASTRAPTASTSGCWSTASTARCRSGKKCSAASPVKYSTDGLTLPRRESIFNLMVELRDSSARHGFPRPRRCDPPAHAQ